MVGVQYGKQKDADGQTAKGNLLRTTLLLWTWESGERAEEDNKNKKRERRTSGPDTISPPAALALSAIPSRSGSRSPMPLKPSPIL